jgi:hypothetical protein
MKNIITFMLLCFCAFMVMAEEAQVLPKGVGRIYIVPTYTFWNKEVDSQGKSKDAVTGSSSVFGAATAIQYGLNDFISLGARWQPGWVFSDNYKEQEKLNNTGLASVEVGGRVQIVGENAPIKSKKFRFAFSPGIVIPTNQYDGQEQAKNFFNNQEFSNDGISPGSFGFGLQTTLDYLISPRIYVNIFNEIHYYFPEPYQQAGVALNAAYSGAKSGVESSAEAKAAGITSINEPSSVWPGHDVIFELESVYQGPFVNSVILTSGIAVNLTWKTEQEFTKAYSSGLPPNPQTALVENPINDALNDEKYLWSLWPTAGFLFTALPIPLELQFDYIYPLMGRNTPLTHTVLFQLEVYFGFNPALAQNRNI